MEVRGRATPMENSRGPRASCQCVLSLALSFSLTYDIHAVLNAHTAAAVAKKDNKYIHVQTTDPREMPRDVLSPRSMEE